MAYPTLEVSGRTIIVLQDIDAVMASARRSGAETLDDIRLAVRDHPDAVAFGYFEGSWVPAA